MTHSAVGVAVDEAWRTPINIVRGDMNGASEMGQNSGIPIGGRPSGPIKSMAKCDE